MVDFSKTFCGKIFFSKKVPKQKIESKIYTGSLTYKIHKTHIGNVTRLSDLCQTRIHSKVFRHWVSKNAHSFISQEYRVCFKRRNYSQESIEQHLISIIFCLYACYKIAMQFKNLTLVIMEIVSRSSRPEVFLRKGVLDVCFCVS